MHQYASTSISVLRLRCRASYRHRCPSAVVRTTTATGVRRPLRCCAAEPVRRSATCLTAPETLRQRDRYGNARPRIRPDPRQENRIKKKLRIFFCWPAPFKNLLKHIRGSPGSSLTPLPAIRPDARRGTDRSWAAAGPLSQGVPSLGWPGPGPEGGLPWLAGRSQPGSPGRRARGWQAAEWQAAERAVAVSDSEPRGCGLRSSTTDPAVVPATFPPLSARVQRLAPISAGPEAPWLACGEGRGTRRFRVSSVAHPRSSTRDPAAVLSGPHIQAAAVPTAARDTAP